MEDYQATFLDFWSDIVLNEDGVLDLDSVARELHDYKNLMDRHSELVFRLTDGMLSKTTYTTEAVLSAADEVFERRLEERYEEGRRDGYEEGVSDASVQNAGLGEPVGRQQDNPRTPNETGSSDLGGANSVRL